VVDLDLLILNARKSDHVEMVALLAKEGWQKAQLCEYHSQQQALNRFTLAALLSDSILGVLRREIRRMSPDVRVEEDDIRTVREADVLKREVLEGEKAEAARRHVARAAGRALRAAKAESGQPKFIEQLREVIKVFDDGSVHLNHRYLEFLRSDSRMFVSQIRTIVGIPPASTASVDTAPSCELSGVDPGTLDSTKTFRG
jgi:hypothetical protein